MVGLDTRKSTIGAWSTIGLVDKVVVWKKAAIQELELSEVQTVADHVLVSLLVQSRGSQSPVGLDLSVSTCATVIPVQGPVWHQLGSVLLAMLQNSTKLEREKDAKTEVFLLAHLRIVTSSALG